MKFTVAVTIFVYCFGSSATNDAFLDNIMNETKCNDDLITLHFSNSTISDIGQDFISSTLITCLNLEHNNVRNIAKGAFDKLPNLMNLNLSYNYIDVPHLFSFGSHEKLRVLWLDGATNNDYSNSIEIVGIYPNLEILSMCQNGITGLQKRIYTDRPISYYPYDQLSITNVNQNTENKDVFPKLKYLDLSGNSIYHNNFVKLLPESLMYLYLNHNSLNWLHLNNLKKLMVLTLHNNKLSRVSDDLLNGLENLNYLSLSNNEIDQVEPAAFIDTFKLNYLNLSSNKLNFLDSKAWAYLQSLETLDLSHNQLTVFSAPTREMNIRVLSLSYNKITTINFFANMPQLTELLLNNNQIQEIYTDKFSNLYNLIKLDLSENKLSFLPTDWAESFTNLEYLDLSNNKFTSLESLSLTKEMPLLKLYFEMNPLSSFSARSIESLPQNVTVNLAERSAIQTLY